MFEADLARIVDIKGGQVSRTKTAQGFFSIGTWHNFPVTTIMRPRVLQPLHHALKLLVAQCVKNADRFPGGNLPGFHPAGLIYTDKVFFVGAEDELVAQGMGSDQFWQDSGADLQNIQFVAVVIAVILLFRGNIVEYSYIADTESGPFSTR